MRRIGAPEGAAPLGRTFDAEGGTADHHAGQLPLVGRPGNRADQPSPAQDADAVADGTHLRQLVADEYDRHPVGHQRAQRGEERVHLVRHEDRGRLVEDEDPAVARERLENLDALLLPDRQLVNAGRRIDTNPEALRRIGPTAAGLVQVETHPARPSEGKVLRDGHRPHQSEVLRDHPDAGPDRVARRADRLQLAVDPDLTGIRVRQPVGDAHDGRLARAVLAEQRVDLAATDIEVDAVVGDEVSEPLCDPAQLESGRVSCHAQATAAVEP